MGFIRAERKQQVLFGYSLDEFVPADAVCRFVVDLVSALDLSDLYADYSPQGGEAYDPGAMLATWFLAYTEGVTSTRKLEERCGRDMHFIYASGNLRPDHTSLSRFRQRHLRRLPDLFVQIVRLAQNRGLSQFRTICIDGTRLKANANPGKSLSGTEIERHLAKIRAQISEYLQQCELSDGGGSEEQIREELQRLEQKQKLYEERLPEFRQRRSSLHYANRERHRINLTDPDALKMKKVNAGHGVPGYNGQASVDAESGLIVAAEAVTDANDTAQFSRQHAQAEGNLGQDPERSYVADSGYHSLEQLEYVEDRQVDAVIDDIYPDRRSPIGAEPKPSDRTDRERAKRSDFVYDPQADEYICPMGRRLFFRTTRKESSGQTLRIYWTDCRGCEHRVGCTSKDGKPGYKRIFRDPREGLAEAMAAKAGSEAGRARLNTRFATVERVFGHLKENLGFRGVRLRGIEKVRGEWLLMCIGHNLKRMLRLIGTETTARKNHCHSSKNVPTGPFWAPSIPLTCYRYGAAA